MITITTLAQLAEALADGLRLEDVNQRGRGLSETEALELIGAGAQLIILGEAEHREVPRKHGRSGALNDLAVFKSLIAPMPSSIRDSNAELMHAINHCPLPINADRPLYPLVSLDGERAGELIDVKTTFDSPRCVSYSTARGSDRRDVARKQIEGRTIRYPIDRNPPSVFDAGAFVQQYAIEQNHRAIRLALIPPSRS